MKNFYQWIGRGAWVTAAIALAACSPQPSIPSQPPVTSVAAVEYVVITGTPLPTYTPVPTYTPAPDQVQYPDPIQTHMACVDEYFERGYAIWLPDWRQIWILVEPVVAPGQIEIGGELIGPTAEPQVMIIGGPWYRFTNDFAPGTDIDQDPKLTPPPGMQQPKGGIGKIWRSNPELQAALGWARDWERPFKTFINSYAIGVLGKGEGFAQTGRILTFYASDGQQYYIHEEAGVWSRP
ncbi:MAG: hypothetical protein FJ030_17135 [Chloroflexi bacterium]|nr:hypothetical protein [Chloroflexota bacterium]